MNPIINNDLCPASDCEDPQQEAKLELRPGFAFLCVDGDQTFTTYLRGPNGEVKLVHGLEYTSSDEDVLSINGSTGVAQVEGAGNATVKVTWQGLSAEARVTVRPLVGDDCCKDVQVRLVVVGDESGSMHAPFGLSTRRQLIPGIVKAAIAPNPDPVILSDRTKAATILFSEAPALYKAFTTDPTETLYPASLSALEPEFRNMPGKTDLSKALDLALDTMAVEGGDLQAILLFSDGRCRPALTTDEFLALLYKAEEFKQGGGIIIVVGLGADKEGYGLLANLASAGFFINIVPPLDSGIVESTAATLRDMLCRLCAGELPVTGYVGGDYTYGCDSFDVGAQVPDPNDYGDAEEGVEPAAEEDLPQLPCPTFSPASGAHIGGGIHVFLSVPGHSDALIRFTADATASPPADPGFLYPSADLTGQDYDGGYALDGIPITTPYTVKAIARKPGYKDSNVCTAAYIT